MVSLLKNFSINYNATMNDDVDIDGQDWNIEFRDPFSIRPDDIFCGITSTLPITTNGAVDQQSKVEVVSELPLNLIQPSIQNNEVDRQSLHRSTTENTILTSCVSVPSGISVDGISSRSLNVLIPTTNVISSSVSHPNVLVAQSHTSFMVQNKILPLHSDTRPHQDFITEKSCGSDQSKLSNTTDFKANISAVSLSHSVHSTTTCNSDITAFSDSSKVVKTAAAHRALVNSTITSDLASKSSLQTPPCSSAVCTTTTLNIQRPFHSVGHRNVLSGPRIVSGPRNSVSRRYDTVTVTSAPIPVQSCMPSFSARWRQHNNNNALHASCGRPVALPRQRILRPSPALPGNTCNPNIMLPPRPRPPELGFMQSPYYNRLSTVQSSCFGERFCRPPPVPITGTEPTGRQHTSFPMNPVDQLVLSSLPSTAPPTSFPYASMTVPLPLAHNLPIVTPPVSANMNVVVPSSSASLPSGIPPAAVNVTGINPVSPPFVLIQRALLANTSNTHGALPLSTSNMPSSGVVASHSATPMVSVSHAIQTALRLVSSLLMVHSPASGTSAQLSSASQQVGNVNERRTLGTVQQSAVSISSSFVVPVPPPPLPPLQLLPEFHAEMRTSDNLSSKDHLSTGPADTTSGVAMSCADDVRHPSHLPHSVNAESVVTTVSVAEAAQCNENTSCKTTSSGVRNACSDNVDVTSTSIMSDEHLKCQQTSVTTTTSHVSSKRQKTDKVDRVEEVAELVKAALKPFFKRGDINKMQYKDIMKKAVPKICASRTIGISPKRVQTFIGAYVARVVAANR